MSHRSSLITAQVESTLKKTLLMLKHAIIDRVWMYSSSNSDARGTILSYMLMMHIGLGITLKNKNNNNKNKTKLLKSCWWDGYASARECVFMFNPLWYIKGSYFFVGVIIYHPAFS